MSSSPPIRRSHLIVLVVFLLSFAGLKIWNSFIPTRNIVVDGQTIHVFVADTPARRFVGLGGRKSLGTHDGMLFLFDQAAPYPFVMRDMEFAIDIIWILDGEIVDIAPNVQPEQGRVEQELTRYYPRMAATMVLEVPGGWAETHGIGIGDPVTHQPSEF